MITNRTRFAIQMPGYCLNRFQPSTNQAQPRPAGSERPPSMKLPSGPASDASSTWDVGGAYTFALTAGLLAVCVLAAAAFVLADAPTGRGGVALAATGRMMPSATAHASSAQDAPAPVSRFACSNF